MRLTVRATAVGTLTLKLAESLNVYGVVGEGLGRLLALRVRGQNSVLVNLPRTLVRGTTISLTIAYGGRLAGASADREAVAVQQDVAIHEEFALTAEPRLLYSNRSYWYPQAPVTDYATGVLRLTVPDKRACVASGTPASGNPVRVTSARGPGLRYVFLVNQPARYFSTVISRLDQAGDAEVKGPSPITVAVQANPRQRGSGRRKVAEAAAILDVYGDVLGDFPYPSLTLALVDDPLPGGHSPAYFALVNQPLPATKFTWANDPVAFDGYPQFFLAHEIAHQFWGGAVGWESYHEQWISEGFAQYFALLYAERSLDADRVDGHPPQAAHDRDVATPIKARSGSAIASATCRRTDACSAPSSTTRARWCCTCCGAGSATTPSSAACARSTRNRATPRSARGTCSAPSRPSRGST